MTRTLRKPLWRWEPAPYVLLIVLMLATGSVVPDRNPVVYWVLFAATVAAAAVVIVLIVVQLARGRRNPDAVGMLSSLDGLELVPLASSSAPPTPVVDASRHQSALDSARARAGVAPVAVLVPDATRWLALRIRVAVHVVVPGKVYHVGFLPEQATARYDLGLRNLAVQRRFVTAPARVIGTARPFAAEVDLGSLDALLAATT